MHLIVFLIYSLPKEYNHSESFNIQLTFKFFFGTSLSFVSNKALDEAGLTS